jgi:hypothetical protein
MLMGLSCYCSTIAFISMLSVVLNEQSSPWQRRTSGPGLGHKAGSTVKFL